MWTRFMFLARKRIKQLTMPGVGALIRARVILTDPADEEFQEFVLRLFRFELVRLP